MLPLLIGTTLMLAATAEPVRKFTVDPKYLAPSLDYNSPEAVREREQEKKRDEEMKKKMNICKGC